MDIIDNSTDIFLIMHFSLHVRIESTDGKDVQLLMGILYSSNAKVENLISVAFRISDLKHIIHWYCTYNILYMKHIVHWTLECLIWTQLLGYWAYNWPFICWTSRSWNFRNEKSTSYSWEIQFIQWNSSKQDRITAGK